MTQETNAAQSPILTMQGVSKWYGDYCALHDINLSVKSGERLVICGPSGSGKSTLIRCINQLEEHEKGEIVVDGLVADDNPANILKIRRSTSMVFQHFNLFPHRTILQNLTMAPVRNLGLKPAEAKERAMHFLERVRIADQADKYPTQLSGGQQQRVAIARALCMEPKLMLFDEPTSALDPEMIHGVLEVMAELADAGMTMICVTHEMGFAKQVADTVAFMDFGEIIETAPPQQFFDNPQSERAQLFLSQILDH